MNPWCLVMRRVRDMVLGARACSLNGPALPTTKSHQPSCDDPLGGDCSRSGFGRANPRPTWPHRRYLAIDRLEFVDSLFDVMLFGNCSRSPAHRFGERRLAQ